MHRGASVQEALAAAVCARMPGPVHTHAHTSRPHRGAGPGPFAGALAGPSPARPALNPSPHPNQKEASQVGISTSEFD
ncbi:MAG: hypothetical protein JWM27_1867 [Gemmatimonadetes bacterium]|nr:hypothetical protein [Gemmatimonadota bacterium]